MAVLDAMTRHTQKLHIRDMVAPAVAAWANMVACQFGHQLRLLAPGATATLGDINGFRLAAAKGPAHRENPRKGIYSVLDAPALSRDSFSPGWLGTRHEKFSGDAPP